MVDSLVHELGAAGADLAVLFMAAVDFPDEEETYRAAAERRGWAVSTIVGNDTFAVLRAGSKRGWGVAVTCGAGINSVGVAPDGRHVRFPSLGTISGDWGGGTDVGLAAVYAAARSADGRGPCTTLERLVPGHFGIATPEELARALHSRQVAWEELGTLPPLVFSVANTDSVAGEIVDRLGDEVVALARAGLTRLGIEHEPVDVVLGGGLLQSRNERLLSRIERGLHEVGSRLDVRVLAAPPLLGAALAGLDALGADDAARARLRDELAAVAAA